MMHDGYNNNNCSKDKTKACKPQFESQHDRMGRAGYGRGDAASETVDLAERHGESGTITDEIAQFLERNRLGYVATTGPHGRPNISPKGTITRWDENTLIFADIRSPDTARNIECRPDVEINVIDPILRKGYLFAGRARVINDKAALSRALGTYKKMGIKSTIRAIVAVAVSSVSHVTSPIYDMGVTEEEVSGVWRDRLCGR